MHLFWTAAFYHCSQRRKILTIKQAFISVHKNIFSKHASLTVSHWKMTPVMYFNTFKWLSLKYTIHQMERRRANMSDFYSVYFFYLLLLFAITTNLWSMSICVPENSNIKYIFFPKSKNVIIVSWGSKYIWTIDFKTNASD